MVMELPGLWFLGLLYEVDEPLRKSLSAYLFHQM